MQIARGRSASARSRSYVLWLVFLFVLVSAVSLRVWQNNQRRVSYQRWQAQCRQLELWGENAKDQLWALWSAHKGSDLMSRTEVEKRLNDGKPFVLKKEAGGGIAIWGDVRIDRSPFVLKKEAERDIAIWTDVRSGRSFGLKFSDDKWSGVGTVGAARRPPAPTPSAFDEMTEAIRVGIVGGKTGWGPLLWIALLVFSLAVRGHRMLLGQLLLGVALLCFTAWLVAPNYSLTLYSILRNDNLLWGIVMLTLSTGVIGWTFFENRRRRRAPPLCPRCEYNLTSNVTGRCPECGGQIPDELQLRLQVDGGPTDEM